MTQNAWNTDQVNADGELLIGRDTGRAAGATISAGSANVTVTNGSNSITIATVDSSSQWVKIASSTASSSSSIDFTGLSSTYEAYKVAISGLKAASNQATLFFRTSTDNGSNFDAGSSDYQWGYLETSTSSNSANVDTSDSKIHLTDNEHGDQTNETADLEVTIYDPTAASYTKINWSCMMADDSSATRRSYNGGGYRQDTTAVDAIRFIMDSGNIASGEFVLYGIEA